MNPDGIPDACHTWTRDVQTKECGRPRGMCITHKPERTREASSVEPDTARTTMPPHRDAVAPTNIIASSRVLASDGSVFLDAPEMIEPK